MLSHISLDRSVASPDCIETVSSSAGSLMFVGHASLGGSMPFGRFKSGKPIVVKPGDHSYRLSPRREEGHLSGPASRPPRQPHRRPAAAPDPPAHGGRVPAGRARSR